MCGFCAAAEVADPCGVKTLGSIQTDLGSIAFSIPNDTSSTETITIGGVRNESLETIGDQDWFRIELTAGEVIEINLFGLNHDSGNGLGALEDPFVRVHDASGEFLAGNDDIVPGLQRDSRLAFQANETATYFIEVDSYQSRFVGDYRLQVATPLPASPIDAIQTNFVLNTDDPVLVYFAEAGDTYSYDGDTYIATGVNAYEQAQLFSVFEGVEQFIDVDFQITSNRTAADLEWATDTLPSTSGGTLLGFFFFPSSSGNGGFGVLNNNSSSFPSWNSTPGGTLDTGGFMYGVAVHELGHGLGLAHPHDTGGGSEVMQGVSSSSSRGNFGLNSAPFTALSYNEGWADNPAGLANNIASTGHGATFGALDIAALQNMYGANTTHAGGNDVYELHDSNSSGSGAGYYATWDTGGTDEFRYTGTRDATIDLRAATLQYDAGGGGSMSHVSGVIAGRTIANGVVIENATGGEGNDTLTGNGTNNLLVGNAGSDSLTGAAGDDTLDGGAGADTLGGGSGTDRIIGGIGNDDLTGGSESDTFAFAFGDGFDLIADFEIGADLIDFLGLGLAFTDLTITDIGGSAQITYDFTASGQVTLMGTDASLLTSESFLLDVSGPPPVPQITGTTGHDNLAGTAQAEELIGLGGDDALNGRAGADTLIGGTGNDRFYMDDVGDTVIEQAGEGYDRAYSSVSFTLADNVEAGATLGTGDIDIIGNDLINWITGNAGTNGLNGGAGNDRLISYGGDDTLNGDAGNDVLEGGLGADVFAFDAGGGTDVITDFEVGVDKIDLTSLGIAYADMAIVNSGSRAIVVWDDPGGIGTRGVAVVNNVSASELLLDSFITTFGDNQPAILGTAGNDVVIGSQIGDEIQGLAGDDLLKGAGGVDTLIGGTGNDSYHVDDADDQIVELAEEGHDRAYATTSYTIAIEVEDLSASGTDAIDLTGNNGANWLTGNTASNLLSGEGGNDRLIGLAGSDTLSGGAGNDLLEGGADADVFRFNVGDGTDTLLDFEDGLDKFDFSSLGMTFNDLRIVDSGANTIIFYDEADLTNRGLVVVSNKQASDFTEADFIFI